MSVIDSFASSAPAAYVPEPDAVVVDGAVTQASSLYSPTVTVSANTDTIVILSSSDPSVLTQAPIAALYAQGAVIRTSAPPQKIVDLITNVITTFEIIPQQSLLDNIVADASLAGYTVSFSPVATDAQVSSGSETHTMSIDQIGVVGDRDDAQVTVAIEITNSAVSKMRSNGLLITTAPGQNVVVDKSISDGFAVALAVFSVSSIGSNVVTESSTGAIGADPALLETKRIMVDAPDSRLMVDTV